MSTPKGKSMKKIFILILLIILTGCAKKEEQYHNLLISNSFIENRVLHIGEKLTIDLSKYEHYEFHSVKFNYNSSVIRINNKEEILALKLGETIIEATIYYEKNHMATIQLYKIIVFDYEDPNMIPINDEMSIKRLFAENPSGFYYINKDIDMENLNSFDPITYFSGILINPKKHVIKNLTINGVDSSAFIQRTSNAYIDGLIFENIKVTGKLGKEDTTSEFTAGLVGEAHNSFISNVHIDGEFSQGIHVGGIAGYLYKTPLVNSSFSGNVSCGKYVGGLVGYYHPDSFGQFENEGVIKNSYAIADIKGGYHDSDSTNFLGGLVGYSNGGLLISSYYCGKVTPDEGDIHSPIISGIPHYIYLYCDVYYVSDYELAEAYYKRYYIEATVYKLSLEELKSGEVLKGLEEFSFKPGEYPVIKNN
jgi:hypothetical protein